MSSTNVIGDAPLDCTLCPRLVSFREENTAKYPDWHNGPVPSFGDHNPKLLIVGLAPGLKGANRTGRPFTGDYAGDLLYPTLQKFGFAYGEYKAKSNDGLQLNQAMITNAVRCVPPQNKPLTTEEKACRPYLQEQIAHLTSVHAILALGLVAHNAVLSTLGLKKAAFKFGHAQQHQLSKTLRLFDSYHCSRYNTNTGRLTTEMFEKVFSDIKDFISP
ncbi:MAG: uracil-DNA glycosylase [Kordiimonas sp.]|nr:uracil-DNA glycosylase [Kordiimonas sp.]|tara:strand:+ start:588 stop:1238 length:651 start_codon:yes stop_codon:yes gene_type:complete